VLSMLLMGFGTFLVSLLPTYEQIGILAPILLVVLRLLQAMGLGGEWGGAVLLVSESAPAQRRGLFGSFVQVGTPDAIVRSIALIKAQEIELARPYHR